MPKKNTIKINAGITSPKLRVIDDEGENLGVLSREQALAQAEEARLDLIEIVPAADPPVAKIMDFGKYRYQEKKKAKGAKGKSHQTETKSIQIKIATGNHDLEIKGARISGFLKEGHRVKIELFLPGRAKYLDRTFLQGRLERVLNFITAGYKQTEEPQKSPKGLAFIIEPDNQTA